MTKLKTAVKETTMTETVTKMSLKSEIVPLQTFNFSVAQLLPMFSGCEFYKTVSMFRKRKRKSFSCVHVLHKT